MNYQNKLNDLMLKMYVTVILIPTRTRATSKLNICVDARVREVARLWISADGGSTVQVRNMSYKYLSRVNEMRWCSVLNSYRYV